RYYLLLSEILCGGLCIISVLFRDVYAARWPEWHRGYSGFERAFRCGFAWSKSAVRAILGNPRYTGRQVWNQQRKDEVLIDVHDVALGHTTKMRWNEAGQWIYSDQVVHPPIIGTDTFTRAQAVLAAKSKIAERGPRRSPRPYSLRGILFCGICGRRMQGSWNNDAPYYRCVFLREYAAKNKINHPRAVYLREDQL